MESLGQAVVVFVDGRTTEYDAVELLHDGVLKVLQRVGPGASRVTAMPAGSTEYETAYYAQHAWASVQPVSTTTVADKSVTIPGIAALRV
jgi:hypothetical protein